MNVFVRMLLIGILPAVGGSIYEQWDDSDVPCTWLKVERTGEIVDRVTLDKACLLEQHPDAEVILIDGRTRQKK